ncbi:hypothetical protein [Collimonas pratensis]|uniref:hypothetical protein n=1 Tax=Collimonas pratensis TaxID=279113 RepID=UPI0007852222|nr:hypothetical protein [Collimonas pratensis]
MSYDYKIFRSTGQLPSSLEDLMGPSEPFESYESVKALLSRHSDGVVWNDSEQAGTLENDIGRFEFQCPDDLLELGMISLRTSFRQDVTAGHDFLRKLCHAENMIALDERTMEIIVATR